MPMPLLRLSQEARSWVRLGVSLAVAGYLPGLACWLALWQLMGDATWWLFTFNGLAIYLFLPLPLALAASLLRRNATLIAGSLAAVAAFALIWGGLFWPQTRPGPEGPVLTVMAYNVLGYNPDAAGVVAALRASDADIIGLSELNPAVARALERELLADYPYQLLEPQEGVRGSGVISRLPFSRVELALDDPEWISPPTSLRVEFKGADFLFVRVHSSSGVLSFAARERQAHLLSNLAGEAELPLVVAGDFNSTDLNDSYAILTEHMYDAWRRAGSGLGNTFPGASRDDSPGSERPDIFGVDLPKWLIRIDYVFCSYDWQPIEARIGPWDGKSDHRPVIAEVALRAQDGSGP